MPLILLLLASLLVPGAETGGIIGGHEVKKHSRPYMAFLQFSRVRNKLEICGGFLIRDNFVLTAAHCSGSFINVTLGAHNIQAPEKTQQHIAVKQRFTHPGYARGTLSNDIMLLQLETKAKLTRAVRLLKLPRKPTGVKPGQVCSVAGWGKTSLSQSTTTLHEVKLIVQQDKECESCFPSRYNSSTQLCVGDLKKNMASFKGDSGGPLVCKNMAQGIVSYGHPQGTPPRAFTKITSYLSWIKETIEHNQLQDSKQTPLRLPFFLSAPPAA
ncbi:granzyme B(G,H)-like [Echinops telfairi]|uniref:Granzyme B(G,H)-like n=1 Tax=Echinops telfairi TaxID=9371 RepID=A0ABM0IFQ6_ECHTE|nr:granzyme B(G,H)-like [Echinops telfairi]